MAGESPGGLRSDLWSVLAATVIGVVIVMVRDVIVVVAVVPEDVVQESI